MSRARTTIFTSNKTQAVRLPKAVAFDKRVREVEITKVGRSRLISPANRSWDAFFDGPRVSEDFLAERAQPKPQKREGF